MNQLNDLQKPEGEDFLVTLKDRLLDRKRLFLKPRSRSSSEPIMDTNALSQVHDNPNQLNPAERLPDSAGTRSEDPPEVHGLSEDRPCNGTRPVPSAWERKKLCCSEGFSHPPGAGTSASGVDPRTDLGVEGDSDRGTGCVSPEPDQRESYRYQVDEMRTVLAWPTAAEIVPRVHGTVSLRSVMGLSGEGSISLNRSRSFGASPGIREQDDSTATSLVLVQASILNISQSGLSVIVDSLPPGDRKLWVGMEGAEPCEWAEVTVRSLSEPQPGRFRLGLSFAHGCPYSLFRIAVLKSLDKEGFDPSGDPSRHHESR